MAPTFTYSSTSAAKDDDIELVEMFLSQFRDENGKYTITARPEVTERKEKAIEAIATAENKKTLAIEHTYIEPFAGQMRDNTPFLTVFEQFRTDSSLRIPNRFLDVLVPAFSVPTGVDWPVTSTKVRDWFLKERDSFPQDGEKEYSIPNLNFELKVVVQASDLPETEGVLVTGRIMPKGSPFDEVLRRAVQRKVPKLVATPADKHILLLEDGSAAIGMVQVAQGLDENTKTCDGLKKVHEVWLIRTMSWKSGGDIFFYRVWPGGVGERFWIKDQRYVKAQAAQTNSEEPPKK